MTAAILPMTTIAQLHGSVPVVDDDGLQHTLCDILDMQTDSITDTVRRNPPRGSRAAQRSCPPASRTVSGRRSCRTLRG
jgi:hypothetical protein